MARAAAAALETAALLAGLVWHGMEGMRIWRELKSRQTLADSSVVLVKRRELFHGTCGNHIIARFNIKSNVHVLKPEFDNCGIYENSNKVASIASFCVAELPQNHKFPVSKDVYNKG